jgi:hypothetical protein
MATGPLCGKDGRLRVFFGGGYQNVAGIGEWSRSASASMQRAVDFEAPTNGQGLPIARTCPGPVTITYEIQGWFFTDPATGAGFSSDLFDAGATVLADFLFKKNGPTGIKGVTVIVENVRMGQRSEGMASFSATLTQVSADPIPLVT